MIAASLLAYCIIYKMVGPAGFEPTTSSPPVKRATKLRYGPTLVF